MTDEAATPGATGAPALPPAVSRATFTEQLDALRARENVRDGDRVYETYWTTLRGVETMDNSYALMDLTVYGRQEAWEDSPPGWPQQCSNTRTAAGSPDWPPVPMWPEGRPIPQWPRLAVGHSDDLTGTR